MNNEEQKLQLSYRKEDEFSLKVGDIEPESSQHLKSGSDFGKKMDSIELN